MRLPAISELDIDHCIEALAEDDAILIVGTETQRVPLLTDEELVRGWEFPTTDRLHEYEDFLEYFTAAKNAAADRTAEMRFVTDPTVGQVAYPGKFRQAFTRIMARSVPGTGGQQQTYLVVQTLRRGWLTAIDDEEWRIETTESTPETGAKGFVRALYFCDPTRTDALLTTLHATKTVTNPKASRNTFTGTFAVTHQQRAENDGSVTILQTCKLLRTAASEAALVALDFLVKQGREILDLFSIGATGSAGLGEGVGEFVACEWQNLQQSSRATFAAFTDANLVTQISTALSVSGYEYADRRWEDQPDGTATFMVLLRKTAFTNTTPTFTTHGREGLTATTPVRVDGTATTGPGPNLVKIAHGIPTDSAEAKLAALAAPSGYGLDSAQLRDDGDGASSITQQLRKEWAYNGDRPPDIVEKVEAVGNHEAAYEFTWLSVQPDRVDDVWTAAGTQGIITGLTNANGWYLAVRRVAREYPNGAADIVSRWIIPRGSYRLIVAEDPTQVWITQHVYRDQQGNAVRTVTIAHQDQFVLLRDNAVSFISTATPPSPTNGWAPEHAIEGTGYTEHGGGFLARRVWLST